jgi:hypothetical protein
MVADIPAEDVKLHLCLRADDGIMLVDTCPSMEVFVAFSSAPALGALRAKHGLPEPSSVDDFPVHAAYVEGSNVLRRGS